MSVAVVFEQNVEVISCWKCGGPIAIANRKQLTESKESFMCPSGHGNVFGGESAAEKKARELQGQLERETRRREMAEREVTQERKRAQNAERKVKRASKGVCTCCNRSFVNLQRHMATQHPVEARS